MTDGGRIDLLCLDSEGQLVIVELKRADAYREALAQALDYAACISVLSYEELKDLVDKARKNRGDEDTFDELLKGVPGGNAQDREPDATGPRLVLVGTGADESLRRIVDYMTAKYKVPVNGVFFDVSVSSSGSTILVRSAVIADEQARRRGRGGITHEELLGLAEERGVDAFVTPILDAWQEGTNRAGRPERGQKCWSLATKSDGRSGAAWLYPYNEEYDKVKTAWLKVDISKLATELNLDEAELRKSLLDEGITVVDDNLIELSSKAHAKSVVDWIRKSFPAPVPVNDQGV
ncbi:MAG: hypothetical protein FWD69_10330 [Polyangiaceae bacterium]|nr:hypothetical protein [Polyangiaceae bacterium]